MWILSLFNYMSPISNSMITLKAVSPFVGTWDYFVSCGPEILHGILVFTSQVILSKLAVCIL